ncbi:MAG: hypothetical protein HDKAJFGB_00209 [Anaerolineae bacterium]|nr:hypothetical protein [Anaerolineae bacterium]
MTTVGLVGAEVALHAMMPVNATSSSAAQAWITSLRAFDVTDMVSPRFIV